MWKKTFAISVKLTKYEWVAELVKITKLLKMHTQCSIKKSVHQNELKMLTMTEAGFSIGFRLSLSGSENQNSIADVLFWPIYKLAWKSGTNCIIFLISYYIFIAYTKTDKFVKCFCFIHIIKMSCERFFSIWTKQ